MKPACVAAAVNAGELASVSPLPDGPDAGGQKPAPPLAPLAMGSRAFARPKSSTFTAPSGVILMLAGLRSRWLISYSCPASSASAICRAIGNASSNGMAPSAIRSASVGQPHAIS